MKKLILVCLLSAIIPLAHSQILISLLLGDKLNSDGVEFGIQGGLNWSSIQNMESTRYLGHLNMGFYFDLRLKNQWNLYTGVLVKSNLGLHKLEKSDLEFLNPPEYSPDGNYRQQISYFILPALIKYKFKNHFYVELGAQGGLMISAWTEYVLKSDQSDVRIRDFNTDKINRIDAGLSGGFGYKLLKGEGFTIGVRYYQGLANVYKGRLGTYNNSIFFNVCIPIGVGKKEAKEAKKETS